jgi:hypothetical protein
MSTLGDVPGLGDVVGIKNVLIFSPAPYEYTNVAGSHFVQDSLWNYKNLSESGAVGADKRPGQFLVFFVNRIPIFTKIWEAKIIRWFRTERLPVCPNSHKPCWSCAAVTPLWCNHQIIVHYVGLKGINEHESSLDSDKGIGNIERHIFAAHFVERADHAALEDRPEPLNGLSVDSSDDILPSRMVNGSVRVILVERIVAWILISAKQADPMRHRFADEGGECGGIHVCDHARNHIALTCPASAPVRQI